MTTKKIRMLILEDNPGDVDLLREMLSEIPSATYELQHVDRVQAALQRLAEETFDIVMIDLSLPDSQGLTTFDTVHARAPHMPIVILSSLNDEAVALEAVRRGAQDYLVKGHIDAIILSRVIRYAIERNEIKLLKNEFISIVNHELRAPFTATYLALQVLVERPTAARNAAERKLLRTAYDNCHLLVRLIDNILDADKLESGQLDLKTTPTDVVQVVKKSVEANQILARQLQIEFRFKPALKTAVLKLDPDRIMQVMTNLLSNAAKYSPPGEKVLVQVKRHERAVRVSVTNRGPAIPPEFQAKVFEKFARYRYSDDRRHKGSGLGLSISKHIIEQSGGHIDYMTIPGQGTTFYFDLPEHTEPKRAPQAKPENAPPARA